MRKLLLVGYGISRILAVTALVLFVSHQLFSTGIPILPS